MRRLVAERRRALRKRQVVVDGLRHVDVGNGVFLGLQELGDAVRGRSRVVAADRHEQFDVVVGEELEVEVVFEIRILGFETAHLQERTSLIEDTVGPDVLSMYLSSLPPKDVPDNAKSFYRGLDRKSVV